MKKRIFLILISVLLLAGILIVPINAESKTAEEIAAKAVEITRSFEGVYSSVCLDDCGAVSVGYLQWHAGRALLLIRSVINANTANAKKILSTALYNEIMNSSTVWTERILTSAEGDQVSKLLDTAEGHAAEDALAKNDVLGYVKHGLSMGITDPVALVYFADTENQCGAGGSARIAKAAAVLAGNSFSAITVDILHKAALEDGAAGKYPVRRSKAYNACLLIPWESVTLNYDYEIWEVNGSCNLRSGPTTDYELLGAVYGGTQIVILEKYAELEPNDEEYTWGRTFMGWFCIQSCKHVSGSIPTPVLCKPNGGEANGSGSVKEITVDAVNTLRAADTVVVYNGEYGTKTGTNKYGAEVVVNGKGEVVTDLVYGSCNQTIPKDGFVVSGIGSGYGKLRDSIKKGYYAHFNIADNKLYVYTSRNDYLLEHLTQKFGEKYGQLPEIHKDGVVFDDWYCGKNLVTSLTKGSSYLVTYINARWANKPDVTVNFNCNGGAINYQPVETALTGFNVPENDNSLVLYNSFNKSPTTETGDDSCEVIVSGDGTVAQILPKGLCDNVIPDGGYILSGKGASAAWLASNLRQGSFLIIEGTKIKAYSCKENSALEGKSKLVSKDKPYGLLPVPVKEGYAFGGWTLADGTSVVSSSTVKATGAVTLNAKWLKLSSSPVATGTADGINSKQGTDSLVIYAGVSSTKTAGGCSEAVIDKTGRVVYVSHGGNATVPDGCTVISGSGTKAAFIENNLTVGRYVKVDGTTFKIYSAN